MGRNVDEVLDAHGHVMPPSFDELHSFLCQQSRMDTILGTRHCRLPSWGLTEPSQLSLEVDRLQLDAAVAFLVLSSPETTDFSPNSPPHTIG